MPRQLDYCHTCHAPIYMENVPGACSCDLGKLRAIQAHLRIQQEQRVQQIRAGATNIAPPDLAAAVQAAANARQAQTNAHAQRQAAARPSLEDIFMADARRATGLDAFRTEVMGEFRDPEPEPLQRPGTIRQAGEPRPVTAVRADPVPLHQRIRLENLWADVPEVRDAMQATGASMEDLWNQDMETEFEPGGHLDPDPNEIQFDNDIDIELPTPPRSSHGREATRFRVDRGAPERRPFNATMEPGPSDGEVVGSIRTRSMSIAEVRERARQAALEGREGPVTTRQATSAEVARVQRDQGESVHRAIREADTRQRPTVYDRLRRGSFLDDD